MRTKKNVQNISPYFIGLKNLRESKKCILFCKEKNKSNEPNQLKIFPLKFWPAITVADARSKNFVFKYSVVRFCIH